MKDRDIIDQIFIVKNILSKKGDKEIFNDKCITVSGYEILKIIDEKKVKTVSEIKEFLPDTLASITQKIKKIEECGCVNKKNSANDSRKKEIVITVKGKKIMKLIDQKFNQKSKIIFSKYSYKEKEIFLDFLKNIEYQMSKNIDFKK